MLILRFFFLFLHKILFLGTLTGPANTQHRYNAAATSRVTLQRLCNDVVATMCIC